MVLLIYALFITGVGTGILTLTRTGWCIDLWVSTINIPKVFCTGHCPLFIPKSSNTLNIHVGQSWNWWFWGFLQ